MQLRQPRPLRPLISLVPLIDVMLILLVFFMVTSTFLDLDMFPTVGGNDLQTSRSEATDQVNLTPVLLRLNSNGRVTTQGRSYDVNELGEILALRLSEVPATEILLLPSPAASLQSLIDVMDRVTQVGAQNLRVIRLEARQ
ncbi:ExbD/TolR family protein [Qingshengfaniella alkalisoli]|uniref:Biopolymer transporter ExbD n=1 Tax=Qingshengfaniella alkalisoli TaxID=2599296 RepID=A0A5B8J259_9RHOB|nr:biopolymer transporter ExbD [Qingshengfaniella alkalisoli]QDY71241.1 biopolymer transporter ExbD [Qingshengfaniella alkalisoli]